MNHYILLKEVGEAMSMTNRLSFLDLDTLEVLKIPVESAQSEGDAQWAAAKESINNDPARYLEIPVTSSKEAYEMRAAFLEHVTEEDAKQKLKVSLEGIKPFKGFRETLLEFPVIREKWFDYHNRSFLYKAAEWLTAEEILIVKAGKREIK